MSSSVVRAWFRSRVDDTPGVVGCPFFDTLNKIPSKKDLSDVDVWCTLEFAGATEERITLGEPATFLENGQVNILVLGKSGRGDAVVLEYAEKLRDLFVRVHTGIPNGSGTGYVHIDAADPPNTDATESGDWFLASVSCAYTFEFTR